MSSREYKRLPQTLQYLTEEKQNANPVPFTSTCEGLLRAKTNKQKDCQNFKCRNITLSNCNSANKAKPNTV